MWKTEVCNSLEGTLLLLTILKNEAKNVSWWWKLLPFGSIVASYISQYKVLYLCVHTLRGMFIYYSSFLLSWNLVGFKNKILFFSIFF